MKFIPLKFKKLSNHWYISLTHDDPNDLKLDPKLERYLDAFDTYKEGDIRSKIYLSEQPEGLFDPEGLIQFRDKDITRYFTSTDSFKMNIYIGDRHFLLSSKLYTLLENEYSLNLHQSIYTIHISAV